ncbi:MAG TPA: hypothetical protein PKH93_12060, partial [Chitinophagales bacterium]|nr:hypothetical protein [Chitinophagales bacterium]
FSIERLNMMYLPLKKGRYAVTNKSMSNIQAPYAGMSIVNYDIIIDDYYLDKDKESWVELTQVDTINNRVEGCFQIYLEIEAPKRGEQNADKLCFKRGRFSVDIIE